MPYPAYVMDYPYPIQIMVPREISTLANAELFSIVQQEKNEYASIELILRSKFGGRNKQLVSEKEASQIAAQYLRDHDPNHPIFNYVLGLDCLESNAKKSQIYFITSLLNDKDRRVNERSIACLLRSIIQKQDFIRQAVWTTKAILDNVKYIVDQFLEDILLRTSLKFGEENPASAGVAINACVWLALELENRSLKTENHLKNHQKLKFLVNKLLPGEQYRLKNWLEILASSILSSHPNLFYDFFTEAYAQKIISPNTFIQAMLFMSKFGKENDLTDQANYQLFLHHLHATESFANAEAQKYFNKISDHFISYRVSDLRLKNVAQRDIVSMAIFERLFNTKYYSRAVYFLANIESCKHYKPDIMLSFLQDNKLLMNFAELEFKRELAQKILHAPIPELDLQLRLEAQNQLAMMRSPHIALKVGLTAIIKLLQIYWEEREKRVAKHPILHMIDELIRHQGAKRQQFIQTIKDFQNHPILNVPFGVATKNDCNDLWQAISAIVASGKAKFRGPHIDLVLKEIKSILDKTYQTIEESSPATPLPVIEPSSVRVAPSAPTLYEITANDLSTTLYPQAIYCPNDHTVSYENPSAPPQMDNFSRENEIRPSVENSADRVTAGHELKEADTSMQPDGIDFLTSPTVAQLKDPVKVLAAEATLKVLEGDLNEDLFPKVPKNIPSSEQKSHHAKLFTPSKRSNSNGEMEPATKKKIAI